MFLTKSKDIKKWIENTWKKFLAALPVIIFFLFLFCTVLLIFGTRCIMVVSIVTVVFKVNYKKRQPWSRLLKVVMLQCVLCLMAYIATLNLPLRIALNFTIPFCLIFLKTNQFNKLAYFSELMAFVFLQLLPLNYEGFILQTLAFLYSLGCFLVVTIIYRIMHPVTKEYVQEKKGLLICAQWMEESLCERKNPETESSLYRLSQVLYQDAFARRGGKEIVDVMGKVSYIFALTFQRVAYFIGSGQEMKWSEDQQICIREKEYVRKCSSYLKKAGSCDFEESKMREELYLEGRRLLLDGEKHDTEIYVAMQNFVRPFLIILNTLKQYEEGCNTSGWGLPSHQKVTGRVRNRLKLDSFEFRFAMRMSIVLTLTFTYAMISKENHAYWLPLNAFLLLRPMYEDSRYRLKTRFIGTVAGCAVVALIYPVLPGYGGHMFLAGMMVACMYTATPGTTAHAIFVTCFSLSMVTLAMGEFVAITLRILYVALAVVCVLIVNRFFFPTSMGQQFRYNVQQIFHLHHVYLRLLRQSLDSSLDYGMICDGQIEYHLIHGQIQEYIEKSKPSESRMYQKFLRISWRMVAEMEQLLFLVNIKKKGTEAEKTMENYILLSEYVLDQVSQHLRLKKVCTGNYEISMKYHRTVSGEPELSYLMTSYAKNLSEIYRMVCEMEKGR